MFPNFTYVSTANEIRTKLLLFVDKEIQSKIKQKKLYYNPQYEEQRNNILYSNINKTYFHHENTFFISSSKFEEKASNKEKKLEQIHQRSQKTISTCFDTSAPKDLLFQSENLKNIPVCYGNQTGKKNFNYIFFPSNNIININEKVYSIKKVLKPSSTFQIYKKQKTDIKYLKNLCNSFKIIKKSDLLFLRQLKSNINCSVNIFNRGRSTTKKSKKK